MNPKEKGEGHRISEEQLKKPKTSHMTPKRMRTEPEPNWRKATKGYLVDQLAKHGWK